VSELMETGVWRSAVCVFRVIRIRKPGELGFRCSNMCMGRLVRSIYSISKKAIPSCLYVITLRSTAFSVSLLDTSFACYNFIVVQDFKCHCTGRIYGAWVLSWKSPDQKLKSSPSPHQAIIKITRCDSIT
jgi:hypothetical protein